MDPITASILGALFAGVLTGVTEIGKTATIHAYTNTKLKGLLNKKLGATSGVMRAIAKLEQKPESPDRQRVFQEEIAAAHAWRDAEVLAAASQLQTLVQQQQQINLHRSTVQGSIIQVGHDQYQAGRDQYNVHANDLVGPGIRRGVRGIISVLLIIGGLITSISTAGMLPFFDSDPTAPAGFRISVHVTIYTIIGLGILMVIGGIWMISNLRKS